MAGMNWNNEQSHKRAMRIPLSPKETCISSTTTIKRLLKSFLEAGRVSNVVWQGKLYYSTLGRLCCKRRLYFDQGYLIKNRSFYITSTIYIEGTKTIEGKNIYFGFNFKCFSFSYTTSYFLSKFVTKMLKIITMLPDAWKQWKSII